VVELWVDFEVFYGFWFC
jgi:hypothetical protein